MDLIHHLADVTLEVKAPKTRGKTPRRHRIRVVRTKAKLTPMSKPEISVARIKEMLRSEDLEQMRTTVWIISHYLAGDNLTSARENLVTVSGSTGDLVEYIRDMGMVFGPLPEGFIDHAYVYALERDLYQIEFPLWLDDTTQSDAWAYFIYDPKELSSRVKLNYIRVP